ncbi:MAG: hypothetical protein M0R77_07965 [Gammaproteobacteria bacterium]|nr:hypothetical protein [Gammaproteobacteria bacterium]
MKALMSDLTRKILNDKEASKQLQEAFENNFQGTVFFEGKEYKVVVVPKAL